MNKLSKCEAYNEAKAAGIWFGGDADEQSVSNMTELADIGRRTGYRQPPHANGSYARYFYYHLDRLRKKHNWAL